MTAASAAPGHFRDFSEDARISDSKAAEQRAHEPSMEEILASIRRIIADDSALPKARVLAQPATVAAIRPPAPAVIAAAQPAPETVPAMVPAVPEAVQPAVHVAEAPHHPLLEKRHETSLSLVHEAPAPPVHAPEVLPAPVPMAIGASIAAPAAEVMAVPALAVAALETASFAQEAAEISPEEQEEEILDLAHHPVAEPDFSFLEAALVAAPVAVSPAAMPLAMEESRPAQAPPFSESLTSPGTDAAVSASFHSLAQTIMLNNTALIEQMTREMLRPMLKNWLDDNLPVMVERLVRTEIERVARGGR